MTSSDRQSAKVIIARIARIDLKKALEQYGIEFNRKGFALCPFHDEKTASFRVSHNRWYCFGCHSGGDLIEFVRRRFDCSFSQAVDEICAAFHVDDRRPASLSERLEAQRRDYAARERTKALQGAETAYLGALDRWLTACECSALAQEIDPLGTVAAHYGWEEVKAKIALDYAELDRMEVIESYRQRR